MGAEIWVEDRSARRKATSILQEVHRISPALMINDKYCMLSRLPKLAASWEKVRKCYDVEDTMDFQQRSEARKLAEDLGFV